MEIDDKTYAQAMAYAYGREDASDETVAVQHSVYNRFLGRVRGECLTIQDFRDAYNTVLGQAKGENR